MTDSMSGRESGSMKLWKRNHLLIQAWQRKTTETWWKWKKVSGKKRGQLGRQASGREIIRGSPPTTSPAMNGTENPLSQRRPATLPPPPLSCTKDDNTLYPHLAHIDNGSVNPRWRARNTNLSSKARRVDPWMVCCSIAMPLFRIFLTSETRDAILDLTKLPLPPLPPPSFGEALYKRASSHIISRRKDRGD